MIDGKPMNMQMLSELYPDIVKKNKGELGWGGDIMQKILVEGQDDIETGDTSPSLSGWDWGNTKFTEIGTEKDVIQDRN